MHKEINNDQYEKARENLWFRNTYLYGATKIVLACLIRDEDTRPLKAPWWKGKEVYLIGVDLDGNFVLRHCDGSVRYWRHETQSEKTISPSVREFVSRLSECDEWLA